MIKPLRVLVMVAVLLAVVAGGYVAYTVHAEKVDGRARHQAEIRKVRAAVISQAAGHTIYAPVGWGAHEYPSLVDTRIYSWGEYGAVKAYLWQVRARDISASTSRFRTMTSLATPDSLCRFTTADRRHHLLLGAQLKAMRCSPVPGGLARIRVVPNDPQPGVTDVRLSMALPEKGRFLNVWVLDETGRIATDPVAWATGFINDLKPYDLTGYSVDDIYRAGAELLYDE